MFPFQLADLPWAFVASLLKSKLLHCAVGHILLLADVLLAYGFLWLVKSFGILQGKRWQARLLHLSYSVNPLGRANMFSRWCQALFLHTMFVHGPEREDVFSKSMLLSGFVSFISYDEGASWFYASYQHLFLTVSQVCSMKEYSECLGHKSKWTTLKMHLREVRRICSSISEIIAKCINSCKCSEMACFECNLHFVPSFFVS